MYYSNFKTVKSCSLFAGPCLPNKYLKSKASISYQEAEEKCSEQYDMHDHITSWWGLQLIINTEAEVNGFFFQWIDEIIPAGDVIFIEYNIVV